MIYIFIFRLGFLIKIERDMNKYLFCRIFVLLLLVEFQRLVRGYLRSPHEFLKLTRGRGGERERQRGKEERRRWTILFVSKGEGKWWGNWRQRSTCMHMLCMAPRTLLYYPIIQETFVDYYLFPPKICDDICLCCFKFFFYLC